MPLLIVALILLVAIFGFRDTLGAIFGGAAILMPLVLVIAVVAARSAYRTFARKKVGGP